MHLDQETKDLTNRSFVFIFPRTVQQPNPVPGCGGNPTPFDLLAPGPCNRRQGNISGATSRPGLKTRATDRDRLKPAKDAGISNSAGFSRRTSVARSYGQVANALVSWIGWNGVLSGLL